MEFLSAVPNWAIATGLGAVGLGGAGLWVRKRIRKYTKLAESLPQLTKEFEDVRQAIRDARADKKITLAEYKAITEQVFEFLEVLSDFFDKAKEAFWKKKETVAVIGDSD